MIFSKTQQKAIQTKNKNILVSAAAGSGKTAVLVQRVVEIIKKPENSIDELLIVTFTRAAAAEMLIRIENAIKELLSFNETQFKDHLRKQLRLLGRAEITTIDSFCARILRKYFYKTDIDPNFIPGEELRLSSLKQEAIDNVIQNAFEEYENGSEAYLPLYDLCDMLSSGSTRELDLETEIINIQRALSALPYPEKCLEITLKALNVSSYEEYLASDFCKIIKDGLDFQMAYEQVSEAHKILKTTFGNELLAEEVRFAKSLLEAQSCEELLPIFKNYDFPKWHNRKKADPELSDKAKALRDSAKEILKNAESAIKVFDMSSYEKYAANLPQLRLLYKLTEDFIAEYDTIKHKKNMYEFSDIERACLNMLVDEGEPTELALELRDHYKEIITDEYQDTSPLQEAILNAISHRNNRFMVGDIKQSIYAFRNADPTIFVDKYNNYIGADDDSENILVQLAENYRSKKHILDFVNMVFSKIMTPELGGVVYEPLNFPENSKYTDDENGTCKTDILIVNRTTTPKPPVNNDDTETLKELAENDAAIEAVLISKKIKEIMAEDPDIKFGDIVILANKLKNIARPLIDTLALCGIPAVTDKPAESTNFIENKTIISLLKAIDNPLSDIDLVTVLHSPIYRVDADELTKIKLECPTKDLAFYDIVKYYCANNKNEITEKLDAFLSDIDYFGKKFKTEPVSTVLSEIYYKTDYYNYLSLLKDSGKRRANLDKLADYAAAYDQNSDGGLYGFIGYLQELINTGELKQAQIINPENNVVHIMTIHASKGLQFPIVFLCNIQKDFRRISSREKIMFDNKLGICSYGYIPDTRAYFKTAPYTAAQIKKRREQAAETMRLYYVAMTRAEKRLIITGSEKLKTSKNMPDYEAQKDNIYDKYYKFGSGDEKTISAGKIYRSPDFLSVLMTALDHSQESKLYELDITNWYELEGVIENTGAKVFEQNINAEPIKTVAYPYNNAVYLPTNLSVTEIKKRINEENYILSYVPTKYRFKKPAFLRKLGQDLTPTERGTAYHALLAVLDYKALPTDIAKFKEKAVEKGILTTEEADIIDNDKIKEYLSSPLVAEISKAISVYKEDAFTMGLKASEIYPELKGDPISENEIILTHGVIDLYYETADGLVIVDFKTDRTKDFEMLKKAYSPQLNIYKNALETALNKKVIRLCLYCLYSGKTLDI